jgi:hypothetical protein
MQLAIAVLVVVLLSELINLVGKTQFTALVWTKDRFLRQAS